MNNLKSGFFLLLAITFLSSCKNENKKEQVNSSGDKQEISKNEETGELSDSPRHHEWVTLSHGNREFKAFVAYPETNEKAKAVIVIHENRGLNDWARVFTDKLASEGYLVIAPDLISNTVEGKERTTDFENPDAAREAIYDLDKDQVTADLNAAFEYIKNDPASTGEVAVVGFCWGGSQTFRYATNNPDISSAHVFYGTAPKEGSELEKIKASVYGYYGGNDNRVNSTIEETQKLMQEAGKIYDYKVYENAGHAFMRSGHPADVKGANKDAHDQAWSRLLKLLN